jgi:hypothetical protein
MPGLFDRIKDTWVASTPTTLSALATFVVSGVAPTGYQTFSARYVSTPTPDSNIAVAIISQTTGNWQISWCTYTAANTLRVDTIIASSNNDNAVTFPAGTSDVFVTPSAKALAGIREINTFTANNTFSANVGIGTTTPSSPLHVVSAASFQPQIIADHVAGAGTGAAYFILDRARGTPSARTAVVSGDILGTLMARGHDGSASQNSAWLSFDVDGTVSAGNVPTGITLFTTPVGGSSAARMHIDADGNVGIGTTGPAKALDVVGQLRIRSTTTSGYALLEYGASATATNNWHVGSEGDGTFRWYSGIFGAGTERMRLDSSGNLGIGTASPAAAARLEVSATGDAQLRITSSDGQTPHIYLKRPGGTSIRVGVKNTDPDFAIERYNSSDALTSTPFFINNDDAVGVGTTAPESRLHVRSDVAAESAIFIQNNNAGGYAALRIGNSDRGTNGDHLLYGSGVFGIRSKTGAPITFEPAGTERMRLNSSGNLGVGLTSPLGRVSAFGTITANFPDTNFPAIRTIIEHGGNAGGTMITAQGANASTGGSGVIRFLTPTADSAGPGIDAAVAERARIGMTRMDLSALFPLRLQTGSTTMDCTPTAGATDLFIWNTSSNANYLWNMAGSTRLSITSTGLIGVGTNTPSQSLDVLRTVAGGLSEIRCYNGSTVDNTTASVLVATGTANAYGLMRVVESATFSARYLFFGAGVGINGGTFFDLGSVFWRSQDTATEYMRLNTAGNLLVGTTSNLARLTVGSTSAAKIAHFQSAVPGTPANIDTQEIITVSANAGVSGLTFAAGDPRLITLTVMSSNEIAWRANKLALYATDTVSLYTGGNERVRLTSTGDLRFEGTHPGPSSTASIGYMGAPVENKTSGYTLALTDAGRTIRKTGTTQIDITIPADATVNFPIGTCIILDNAEPTSGLLRVTGATGVIMYTYTSSRQQRAAGAYSTVNFGGSATIRKIAADKWAMSGAGVG